MLTEATKLALGAVAGFLLAGAAFYPTVARHERAFERMEAMVVSVAEMRVQMSEMASKLDEIHQRDMRRLESGGAR